MFSQKSVNLCLLEVPVHQYSQHGEQAGVVGRLCVVTVLQIIWIMAWWGCSPNLRAAESGY